MLRLNKLLALYFIICCYKLNICAINPDVYLSAPAIIKRHGYPCEIHTVVTDDGFILNLFRIRHGKNSQNTSKPKQPVFIQHGLTADASCFILHGNESLPFLLADADYDIWLGNARGTLYSRGHVKYSTNELKFWDWSWDEMGDYDIPKVLAYIGERTQQTGNILYIGHSMGTTMFFASMASKPSNRHLVKAMFALAPVAYTQHLKGPIGVLGLFANNMMKIYEMLGFGEFLPRGDILKFFTKNGCTMGNRTSFLCQNFIYSITGFNADELNLDEFPVILSHVPSPTSVRCVVQYGQEILPGTFQRFDFGEEENLKRYNSATPPLYNISQISVPVALYYGKNDWLSQEEDVNRLWSQLPTQVIKYVVPLDAFNHVDFLWAIHVKELLFDQLMADMKKFS